VLDTPLQAAVARTVQAIRPISEPRIGIVPLHWRGRGRHFEKISGLLSGIARFGRRMSTVARRAAGGD
jgi:hypothetical protein